MITLKELVAAIDSFAALASQYEWDNCGAIVDCGAPFERVLVALDASAATIYEAQRRGCGALLTHHPVMFHPQKQLSIAEPAALAMRLGVSVAAAHTCWDAAPGGVNDVLACTLDIDNVTVLADNMTRLGLLREPMSCRGLASFVKQRLDAPWVHYTDTGRQIKRVAVLGGAGGSAISAAAAAGADALVVGECAHHEMLLAESLGLCCVAAGHFASENIAVPALAEKLSAALGGKAEVLISECGHEPVSVL